jgi:hypothetical protein
MIQDSTSVRSPLFKRRWFQVSAAILLLLLVAGGVEWWLQSGRTTATALFLIQDSTPSLSGTGSRLPLNEYDFENLKKTQIALVKSNFVLASALRNPSTGALSMLQRRTDPVQWLEQNLDVSFPQNGSLLSISLSGDESEKEELITIVDAVARAYQNEVIGGNRQERLMTRDLLSRNLDNLNSEIKRKLNEYLDIARELGHLDANNGLAIQSLDQKRLERTEDEIMRLENQLAIDANDKPAKAKVIQQRLAELTKSRDGLAADLTRHIERSADLETRRQDLDQLRSIANDMSTRLEWLDLDATAPDRIRQVQPATVSPQSLSSRISETRQQTASTR